MRTHIHIQSPVHSREKSQFRINLSMIHYFLLCSRWSWSNVNCQHSSYVCFLSPFFSCHFNLQYENRTDKRNEYGNGVCAVCIVFVFSCIFCPSFYISLCVFHLFWLFLQSFCALCFHRQKIEFLFYKFLLDFSL